MLTSLNAQRCPAGPADWDRPAAARYLDDRIDLWFDRARQLQTGESKVACLSCHTAVPYLLARPALRKAMMITEPTPQEARLLLNVSRRVEARFNRAPMSDAKHGGESGTEEVLNALILARHDADEGRSQASEIRIRTEVGRSTGWDPGNGPGPIRPSSRP